MKFLLRQVIVFQTRNDWLNGFVGQRVEESINGLLREIKQYRENIGVLQKKARKGYISDLTVPHHLSVRNQVYLNSTLVQGKSKSYRI